MARKNIPEKTKKLLLEETTHRCGICFNKVSQSGLAYDIAHIIPYTDSQDNSFENLLILCVNCHATYTRTVNKIEETKRLKKIKSFWLTTIVKLVAFYKIFIKFYFFPMKNKYVTSSH